MRYRYKYDRHLARHHGNFHHVHRHHQEFHKLHHSLKYWRPLFLLINVIITYFLYKWGGVKAIGIFLALLLVAKEIMEHVFIRKLEKKIFHPLEELEDGFNEIARGNYSVSIDNRSDNEFTQLIDSFNIMAGKLKESENINLEYEENRKNLVAGISHDLKTPITAIQGYIEMLLDERITNPEKIKSYLTIIQNNTSYMNKLIDDLFLFSRLDLDKVEFDFQKVSIRAFMADMMSEFKCELEENNAQLIYADLTSCDYEVTIDGKRVYQAVRNIISNAVRYGPADHLELQVKLFVRENYAAVSIQDNGPGIDPHKIKYIFDRFYRLDMERSKDFMSTGLGLSIAKELLEAQKGMIEAANVNGSGACFTILLPIENDHSGKEAIR